MGIEFSHAMGITILFIIFYFITSSMILVGIVCSLVYLFSKILMAKRPRHWAEDFISYHLGQKVYIAATNKRNAL